MVPSKSASLLLVILLIVDFFVRVAFEIVVERDDSVCHYYSAMQKKSVHVSGEVVGQLIVRVETGAICFAQLSDPCACNGRVHPPEIRRHRDCMEPETAAQISLEGDESAFRIAHNVPAIERSKS